HSAVGVQIVLKERNEHPRRGDAGVVQRVRQIQLPVLAADADLQPPRLSVAEIRAAAYLEILPLPRAPRLNVAALYLEVRQVPGAALQLTHRDVQAPGQARRVAPEPLVPLRALLRTAEDYHLLLLTLVDAAYAALLRAVRALLPAEAGRIARQRQRQRAL